MFLHSGAALHRHEFSPDEPSSLRKPILRRSPLIRSAFSSPIQRRVTVLDKPSPIIQPPMRALSADIPRDHTVRFQALEANTMSDGDGDRSGIMSDDVSDSMSATSKTLVEQKNQRRMSILAKTTFLFAKMPPTALTKKLKVRPKKLIQSQRLTPGQRPLPALDVITNANFASRLIKKSPRMFKGKAEPCVDDLLIVRSENYDEGNDTSGDMESDNEGENRELIAVISKRPRGVKGLVEIAMNDGGVWVANALPNGHFEFVSIPENEEVATTVRWKKRPGKSLSVSPKTEQPYGVKDMFQFCIVDADPKIKCYLFIAKLKVDLIGRTTLELPDSYEAPTYLAPPSLCPSQEEDFTDQGSTSSEPITPSSLTTFSVDENLRLLIQVTGLWLALQLGLSSNFKYEEPIPSAPLLSRPSPGGRMTPDPSKPGSDPNTPNSTQSAFDSMKGRFKRSFSKSGPHSNPASPLDAGVGPKRSVSHASAIMEKQKAKRQSILPSTTVGDGRGENIMHPPKRAATENITTTAARRSSPTPVTRSLHNTATRIPAIPKRRAVSAYYPSAIQPDISERRRNSLDNVGTDQKTSRWNKFKDLFKRGSQK